MRSSKSRSRSKSNRNRSVGNIVNRVFDSSGPDGKVRGTPQQIIDKYIQLARDAQLGNDRVATENFQQHAEHYTRMLGEAQKEAEARREQQEAQNRDRQQRDREDGRGDYAHQTDNGPAASMNGAATADEVEGSHGLDAGTDAAPLAVVGGQTDDDGGDSGLVETPEDTPRPKRRRTRKPKAEGEADPADATDTASPAQTVE